MIGYSFPRVKNWILQSFIPAGAFTVSPSVIIHASYLQHANTDKLLKEITHQSIINISGGRHTVIINFNTPYLAKNAYVNIKNVKIRH
jgi:hypothetical protein